MVSTNKKGNGAGQVTLISGVNLSALQPLVLVLGLLLVLLLELWNSERMT